MTFLTPNGIVEIRRCRKRRWAIIRRDHENDKSDFWWFDGQEWSTAPHRKIYKSRKEAAADFVEFVITQGWPNVEIPF